MSSESQPKDKSSEATQQCINPLPLPFSTKVPLVLFDANGVLFKRYHKSEHREKLQAFEYFRGSPDFYTTSGDMAVYLRPGIGLVLHRLTAQYGFRVGIYSSMMKHNLNETVRLMLKSREFAPLMWERSRSGSNDPLFRIMWHSKMCDKEPDGQYPSRKNMCRVWHELTNDAASDSVVLVDDSAIKVRSHPQHAVVIPSFDPFTYGRVDPVDDAHKIVSAIVTQLGKLARGHVTSAASHSDVCPACVARSSSQSSHAISLAPTATQTANTSPTTHHDEQQTDVLAASVSSGLQLNSSHNSVSSSCADDDTDKAEKKRNVPEINAVYQHYRNHKLYRVLCIALHTDNEAPTVVYQGLYNCSVNPSNVWCRPLADWNKPVAVDSMGALVARFVRVDNLSGSSEADTSAQRVVITS